MKTDMRRVKLLVDGIEQPLAKIARQVGASCQATLFRYRRRVQPVTLESLRHDGRKVAGPVRQAGWDRARNHAKRAQVRELLATGKTQAEIARALGTSRQAVNQMIAKLKVQP